MPGRLVLEVNPKHSRPGQSGHLLGLESALVFEGVEHAPVDEHGVMAGCRGEILEVTEDGGHEEEQSSECGTHTLICMMVSATKFLESFNQVEPPRPGEAYPGEDADVAADRDLYAREAKIQKLIAVAFKKLGIEVADQSYAISYDEKSKREAVVKVDTHALTVRHLAGLYQSGLADEYRVSGHDSITITVEFSVSPDLDHAV